MAASRGGSWAVRRTELLQELRIAEAEECFGPLRAAGAEQAGGCRAVGDRRADVSALVPALPRGGGCRAYGPAAGQAIGQAGSGGRGHGRGAAVPGALCGVHGDAFPRAPGRGPRVPLGLHLDQGLSARARGWCGRRPGAGRIAAAGRASGCRGWCKGGARGGRSGSGAPPVDGPLPRRHSLSP